MVFELYVHQIVCLLIWRECLKSTKLYVLEILLILEKMFKIHQIVFVWNPPYLEKMFKIHQIVCVWNPPYLEKMSIYTECLKIQSHQQKIGNEMNERKERAGMKWIDSMERKRRIYRTILSMFSTMYSEEAGPVLMDLSHWRRLYIKEGSRCGKKGVRMIWKEIEMESEEAEWERFILWIILDPYYLVDSKSPFNFNFKSLILCYPTATASPGETLKGNTSHGEASHTACWVFLRILGKVKVFGWS